MLMTKKDLREIKQVARDKRMAEATIKYAEESRKAQALQKWWHEEAPKIRARNQKIAEQRYEVKKNLEALKERERYERKARGTIQQRKLIARAFILEYLKKNPCNHCGEVNLMVLEFDHCRGKKDFNISTALHLGFPLDSIRKELEKCQVLCANCHAIKSQRESKSWRYQASTSC
jgi:DNA-binding transcriptional MerR regulator